MIRYILGWAGRDQEHGSRLGGGGLDAKLGEEESGLLLAMETWNWEMRRLLERRVQRHFATGDQEVEFRNFGNTKCGSFWVNSLFTLVALRTKKGL